MEATNAQNLGEYGGRFVVQGEICRRPSCIIYRAADKNLGGREVVLKVYIDGPGSNGDFIKSFDEEIAILRSASHRCLVPIIASGFDRDSFYIAMEYIQGPSLKDKIKEGQVKWGVDDAIAVIAQVAEAVGEIHEKGVLHGHLDSRAILFKDQEPRVAGYYPPVIAKIQKMATSAGRVLTDPAYIAPEQIGSSDKLDGRADIYAITVLLFEMVTGQRPFQAANPIQAAMLRATQAPPSARKIEPSIPPLLDAAIEKGMARDPKDRFQNVTDFVDAIKGGKGEVKNPLEGMSPRLGTETIAVSFSTDALKEMLKSGATSSQPSAGGTVSAKAVTPDTLGTAMGIPAQSGASALKPSFIMLSATDRGKKFPVQRTQVIIGSDPTCDIVIAGKGIPPRMAIVVERDTGFFVAPLSSEPLVINDTTRKGTDEVKLERGDILSVGDNKLRYVAPGEVFTLKDEVADRVIDRPKSKTPAILLGVATAVATAAIGGFYLYQEQQSAREIALKKKSLADQQEREEHIKRLLREGDELFKSGALVEPTGNNAEERFRTVLQLSPNHEYAKNRLEDISRRLKQLESERSRREQFAAQISDLLANADRYFQRKELIAPPGKNAKESYLEVLRLDPANELAKGRVAEIDRLMQDLAGQVGSIMESARAAYAAGNYITPEGSSALDYLKKAQAVDINNTEAQELILDMAANSIFRGDQAKKIPQPDEARRQYLIAKAVGVDPAVIDERMRGLDFIKRSKSSVVIYSGGEKKEGEEKVTTSGGAYLNTAEIERRVAKLMLAAELSGAKTDSRVIDLKARTK